MKLESEYNVLRAEILQTFSELSSLTYVTTISSAVAIWGLYQAKVPIGIGVIMWQLILIGICGKLKVNYSRIYRLCTYIKVVHEQKLIKDYSPKQDEIGWLTRSRFIGKLASDHWRWASGPIFDCVFLRLLSLSFFVLSMISFNWKISPPIHGVFCIILNCLLFAFVLYSTQQVLNTRKISEWFEKELLSNFGHTVSALE